MRLSGILRVFAMLLAATVAAAADLPPLPQGLSAPKTAMKLPAFKLQTATGGSVSADELKGKVIVARYWATW